MASTYAYLAAGSVNEILKDLYDANFPTLFNNESVLLSRLQRSSRGFNGKQWVAPVHTASNEGVGPRGETGLADSNINSLTPYLPAPGSQSTDQAVLTPKHYYARFGISGVALDQADNMGAVIDLAAFEMNGARRDLAKAVNRDFFGDGTGALAEVVSGGSTTVTLYASSGTGSAPGHLWLNSGQTYTFASRADGSSAVDETVSVFTNDGSNDQVTSSGSNNATADWIFPRGITATGTYASAWQKAVSGLNLIVSDSTGSDLKGAYPGTFGTTYATIAKGTVSQWNATELTASGGGIDLDIMHQAQQDMRYGNGTLSLIICHPVQWRAYGMIMGGDARRWNDNQMTLDGGFQALNFNGVPVVADLDCPKDVMYFLDESTFTILETKPPHLLDKGAGPLTMVGSGSTASDLWEGTLAWRLELFCNNPRANAVIKALPY